MAHSPSISTSIKFVIVFATVLPSPKKLYLPPPLFPPATTHVSGSISSGISIIHKCDSVSHMASACMNNIALSPENFLDCSPAYSYVRPAPRLSIGREMPDLIPSPVKLTDLPEQSDPELSDIVDFEFRLEKSVTTLPADDLFSDGKLFPLNLTVIRKEANTVTATNSSEITSSDTPKPRRIPNGVPVIDSFLYSPKAPRCSSKWKELIGFRKKYQNNNTTTSSPSSRNSNSNGATRSIKQFLHRSSKSSNDSSVNLPLLNDTDNEPTSVTLSRLSLSSSSSGHDPDEVPRLSLDSEKPVKLNLNLNQNLNGNSRNIPTMKTVKTRTLSGDASATTRVIESPRMNASGKIVFHNLERSSSSPSSFNGGPKFKHRGVERSYSANVRVTPVLNVAVCSKSGSVFGLPLFSSSHKQDGSSGSNKIANRSHRS